MAKFILGYHNPEDDFLTQYDTKEKASYESEEWCEVEADTLEEARAKYDDTYLNLGKVSSI